MQRFIQALLEEEVTELLGRTKSARREAVAAPSGYRNGYGKPWRCTIADGHLGLWAALGEQDSTLAEQRCWNHRITKVLDALPKKYQAEARTLRCALPYAETQAAGEALRTQFTTRSHKVAPQAVERLADDGERLVTFSQFPREPWPLMRTTTLVEPRSQRYGCAPPRPSVSRRGRTRRR